MQKRSKNIIHISVFQPKLKCVTTQIITQLPKMPKNDTEQ